MCSACTQACPQQIEVSSHLISKLYYYDQLGDREAAWAFYSRLPKDRRHEGNCRACRTCEKACPNNVQILTHLQEVTRLFGA